MAQAKEDSKHSGEAIWKFLRHYFNHVQLKENERKDAFTIMVVGETGTGKSCLINNLLGCDVAKEGDTVQSETSSIQKYRETVDGVQVVLYDTPGLSDSDSSKEQEHIAAVKRVLTNGKIQLVIYCQRLSETRMRSSLIHTFHQYHKIGVDWTRAVIALTFADSLPISGKEKKKADYDEGKYFNRKLKEWQEQIRRTLVKEVRVNPEYVQSININPTCALREEDLPNGEGWFVPLWLGILKLLTPDEMYQLLKVENGRVSFKVTEKEKAEFEKEVTGKFDSWLATIASKCAIL